MAQESYSNDVTCVKADDNIAVITASGTAEKEKDVYNMALKSIFNAIFLNGIDGVENGQPLVGKEDSYYMNQFFSSRYMLFVKNYETVGRSGTAIFQAIQWYSNGSNLIRVRLKRLDTE